MQARAVFEAAIATSNRGFKVVPEIMIPLVGTPQAWMMDSSSLFYFILFSLLIFFAIFPQNLKFNNYLVMFFLL